MNITLCGSIAFIDEMDAVRKELESMGHTVEMPPLEIMDDNGRMIPVKEYYALRKSVTDGTHWIWKKKAEAMRNHFDKVARAEAILVCNHDKNGIAGYVGANTLLEMGLAFHLKKPTYLLHSIPEVSYKEEILGMQPIVIDGDLKKIK
ncbi:MAG: hypothetical protein WAW00_02410 [Candidatus Moraniibacteriota bacterium]